MRIEVRHSQVFSMKVPLAVTSVESSAGTKKLQEEAK